MGALIGLVAVAGGMICALVFITNMMKFLLNQQDMKHKERLAMIEKGIYVEVRRQESGVPSLPIIILVGIGLAVLAANEEPFLGFALLFIGVGLIVRDRLLRHKKRATGRLSTGPLTDDKPTQGDAPDTRQEPWK